MDNIFGLVGGLIIGIIIYFICRYAVLHMYIKTFAKDLAETVILTEKSFNINWIKCVVYHSENVWFLNFKKDADYITKKIEARIKKNENLKVNKYGLVTKRNR